MFLKHKYKIFLSLINMGFKLLLNKLNYEVYC